jgi:hypothetical protein
MELTQLRAQFFAFIFLPSMPLCERVHAHSTSERAKKTFSIESFKFPLGIPKLEHFQVLSGLISSTSTSAVLEPLDGAKKFEFVPN